MFGGLRVKCERVLIALLCFCEVPSLMYICSVESMVVDVPVVVGVCSGYPVPYI